MAGLDPAIHVFIGAPPSQAEPPRYHGDTEGTEEHGVGPGTKVVHEISVLLRVSVSPR